MDTPTFFSWDNLSGYADGAISTLGNGVVWANPGAFPDRSVPISKDDLSSYSIGSISTLSGGSGWTSNATFTIY